jgi:Holliday junction resolvase RusA-like endonuclease
MIVIDRKATRLTGINKRYVKRYILSNEYRVQKESWKEEVRVFMLQNKIQQITTPVSVKITVSTAKDIDAIVKPVLDALDSTIIKRDSLVRRLLVEQTKINNRLLESIRVEVDKC